ncbi:MAG TPA: N-acetylglucosamine-6-phosphate deacetylase [Thermoanaerobaculia bacterium]|jgi:N-acetylglucosamine-6-phosphate deacetylase|nr:N-acetylglucosamine-6-phosphate deacetylase [Thermoanaerobaculia bacterium]
MRLHGRAFVDDTLRDDILITIEDQVIVDVEQTAHVPAAAEHIDGIMIPGFVDLHVHGGDGADFMDAHEEATERILGFHATHGTTALAATTLSASRADLHAAVESIARVSATSRDAAEIVGIHLEGPFLNNTRAGAQDRASIRPADIHEVAALIAQAPRLKWIVTVAPEIEGSRALIEHFRDRVLFSIGHTAANFGEAAAAIEWGACHFTHLYNAMTPLHHRDPGVVGAALTSVDATAELIADGIHVHPAAMRVAVQAMPRRIAIVTDAMRACGLAEGTYKLYEYEVTVAEGAARLADGTLAGSVLTMDAAMRNMIELAGLPLETVIPMATEIPARIAGVADRKGKIERRYDADIVVMNERFEVERVWGRGRAVGNI